MRYAAGYLTRHAARMVLAGALLLSGHVWAGSNPEVDKANSLYSAGNYQEALEVYERLAQEQPDNPALQFNRGAALYQLGDLPKAREAFEQAGVLSEDAHLQAQSAYNLGNCAFKEGQEKVAQDPDAALRYVETILALDPASLSDQLLKAVLCYNTQRYDEGIEITETLIQSNSPDLRLDQLRNLQGQMKTLREQQQAKK